MVLVDDLIATGGTMKAAAELVEELGGEVVKALFLIELAGLNGREALKGYDVVDIAVCCCQRRSQVVGQTGNSIPEQGVAPFDFLPHTAIFFEKMIDTCSQILYWPIRFFHHDFCLRIPVCQKINLLFDFPNKFPLINQFQEQKQGKHCQQDT